MRLTVGLDVELGPDGAMQGSIGSAAMGPAGLLQVLETHLGLTAPRLSATQRAGQLLVGLARTPGWWSRSFEVDPWGTAQRLLQDLDALTVEGWTGQPVSPRWDALWAVTRDVAPGIGERWTAVSRALYGRRQAWLSVRLVDPQTQWPGATRRVFAALRGAGATIELHEPTPTRATGDLGRARETTPFEPTADGSLQLIRAPGPLEGADDIAAWLRTQPEGSVAIVSADTTLDAALLRHGLPGAGVPADAQALGLLGAALQLEAAVPDPARVLELLLTRPSPIPAPLGHRLARALRESPAVGSPAWVEGLQRWTNPAEGDPPSEQALRRVERLLAPGTSRFGEDWSVPGLRARTNTLQRWARGHAEGTDDPAVEAGLRAVGLQCERFVAMLDALGQPTTSLPTLERLVAFATAEGRSTLRTEAQAGLRFCRRPGGLIEPVPTVVWWNFTRESAPTPRPLGLTNTERGALASAGVEVRSAAARAEALARRWWRPLQMASQRVLLVAPRSSTPGEPLHPHPLWSELVARMPGDRRQRLVDPLERRQPGALPSVPAAALQQAEGRPRLHVVPGSVPRRTLESPSSMATLVGCPLRWTVQYAGKVPGRAQFSMRVRPLEMGTLAHEVLAHVLPRATDPERAHRLALEAFDAIGPRRVAALFQPALATECGALRASIAASARALVLWMSSRDLAVESVEDERTRDHEGQPIRGRLDLVVSGPGGRVVLDHKLGGRTKRADELATGAAVQLATYAFVAERDGKPPHVGYFIVRDQRLLGIAGGPYPDHDAVEGPPPRAGLASVHRCNPRTHDRTRRR